MSPDDFSRFPPATLFNSHVRTLTAAQTGVTYTISIWLPESYATGQQIYPVVYVLDSNVNFGLATDTTYLLMSDHEVPDVILVGIGYPIASYDDWLQSRLRDLSPTPRADAPNGGGAPRFLEFLEAELIPLIEANYRAHPADRTLWGYSLGGTFAIYAFLKRTHLFRRYIAGSPYLGWDNGVSFQYLPELDLGQPPSPITLSISAGEFETDYQKEIDRLLTALRSRADDRLRLINFVLDGESHASGVARTYVRSLKAVFA